MPRYSADQLGLLIKSKFKTIASEAVPIIPVPLVLRRSQKVPKDTLDLAHHIMKSKSGHFAPQKFEDEYENELEEFPMTD